MANRWGNSGNSERLYFGDAKITADGDCSHEIKICLLFGGKAMTNLDSIFKSRDITLLRMVHLVKAMVFPVVVYGCESWTIKKAEHQRIDAFNCDVGEDSWESLDCRRSNQSILKEISPEYSLEGLMLNLELQYFGHPVWRTDSLEKTLRLGKIEGRRKSQWQRMKWLDGITNSMYMSLSWWWTGNSGMLQSMGLLRVWHDWVTELNSQVAASGK